MVERRYRRIYIGGGIGSIIALFVALQLYGLQVIDVSGDIYCQDTCVSYFNVRNPTYRSIYIYNKEAIKLDFEPQIKEYDLYVKYYGKWVPMDFTMDNRLGNVPKDRLFVFVFPRYSTKEFKLVGKKEDWQNVKWTFGMPGAELDPKWLAGISVGDKIIKENCNPVFETIENTEYKNCNCKNASCVTYKCIARTWKEEVQTGCRKTGKVNISGTIYNGSDSFCQMVEDEICCVHNKEGGQYADWKKNDGSVSKYCKNLITNKERYYNSIGLRKREVISVEGI